MRRRPTYTPDLLSAYGLTLDRTACTLHHADRSCRLSGKEYQILEMLLTTPGVILPTDKLIAHIWGWDSNISMNTLWVHISNLRKKLSQLQAPATIRFIHSAGYVLQGTTQPEQGSSQ